MEYIDAFEILERFEVALQIAIELNAKLEMTTEQCEQLLKALDCVDY